MVKIKLLLVFIYGVACLNKNLESKVKVKGAYNQHYKQYYRGYKQQKSKMAILGGPIRNTIFLNILLKKEFQKYLGGDNFFQIFFV